MKTRIAERSVESMWDHGTQRITIPFIFRERPRRCEAPGLERRTRLIARLGRNRQRPLIIISAQAGYGKTMLASQWLDSCDCPRAWISLDESDNYLGFLPEIQDLWFYGKGFLVV